MRGSLNLKILYRSPPIVQMILHKILNDNTWLFAGRLCVHLLLIFIGIIA